MIKKIICWIWGHVVSYKSYPDDIVELNRRTGENYYKIAYNDRCPRCGSNLA